MYGFLITAAGEALLARATAGETLTITGVQVGSGEAPDEAAAKALTALVAPEQEATSTIPIADEGQVSMVVQYSNDLGDGLAEGFMLREFGIFGKVGEDEAETLFFYAALGQQAQPVAPFSEGLDVHRFPVAWAVTGGAQVSLGYPAGAFVSADVLESYIPKADKGKPGGVATLGADGKLDEAQRPEAGGLHLETPGGQAALPASANWRSVAYGGGKFVAVSASNSNISAYSEDGITWTQAALPASASWYSVAYGGGKFVAVATNSNISAYSEDGITWTQTSMPASKSWNDIAYGNSKFVAVSASNSNISAYSEDGITWTQTAMPATKQWFGVAYGNGRFVAVSVSGNIAAYSTDGITWTQTALPASAQWFDIAYGGGKFVAVVFNGNIAAYSEDGISWTQTSMPLLATWYRIAYGNGKFVAVTKNNSIAAYSEDGISWTQTSMPLLATWNGVAFGGDKFVAVASGVAVAAWSLDGVRWTPRLEDGGGEDVTEDVSLALGVQEGLDHKADKSVVRSATLTAAGWAGSGPWTQSVAVAGLKAASNGIVGPANTITDEQFKAMQQAALRPSAQADGSLTITAAGTKPAVDLPIQVMIVG